MDTNIDKIHRCDRCNKTLSCYTSLWRHKQIHLKKDNINKKNTGITCDTSSITRDTSKNIDKLNEIKYNCKYCNRIFNNRNNKWKHEKICKHNETMSELEKLKIENMKQQIEINKLKNININNGSINNGSINNGTINNNIIINQIGKEPINCLPLKDILKIVRDGNNGPITCIQKLNFNKNIPENHSFCTTTLEGKHYTN
jgi:hypothetical protein